MSIAFHNMAEQASYLGCEVASFKDQEKSNILYEALEERGYYER